MTLPRSVFALLLLTLGFSLTLGQAAPPWNIAFQTNTPSGVAFRDEPVQGRVTVTSGDSKIPSAELRLTIQEFGGETRTETRALAFTDSTAVAEIPLPTSRLGYFLLTARLFVADREVASRVSALVVVTRPPDEGKPSPASFFGTMFARDAETAARIGVKCERVQAVWEWLAPSPDSYDWQKLDERVAALAAQGIGTVLVIRPEIAPKWASWKSPEDLIDPPHFARFQKFIEDVVTRYRDRVQGFEIINEPDLEVRRHARGDTPAAQVYARLLQAAADRIRELAPQVPVLGLDVSGVDFPNLRFSREVLDLAPRSLDIIAGHPYTSSRYLGADARAESPDDINTIGRFTAMAALMREHGLTPRIWATEFGWALHKDEPLDSPAASLLAAYIAQAISLARSVPEVEKLFWFSLFFPGYEKGYTYGLFHGIPPEAYPTPGAAAYATCSRFLAQVRFVRDIALPGSARALRFEDSAAGRTVFVLWLKEPRSVGGELTLHLDNTAFPGLELANALGRELSGDWPITALPLFARVDSASADRLEKALLAAPTRAREAILLEPPRLVTSSLLRLDVSNNTGAPVSARLYPADQPQLARSRSLPPGSSTLELSLPTPLSGQGKLPLIFLEDSSGQRRAIDFSYDLAPVRPLPRLRIDGDLAETAALPAHNRQTRDAVLPADPGIEWNGPQDLSLRAWTGWTAEGLYLAVRVTDDVATQPPPGDTQFWRHDSLQIAFDLGNRADSGYDAACREFGVFATPEGAAVRETFPNQEARKDIPVAIRRESGATVYEILFPWAALSSTSPVPGQVFRLNLIANDNDGRERKCWIGLAPGIGETKRPSAFPQWVLDSPNHPNP